MATWESLDRLRHVT